MIGAPSAALAGKPMSNATSTHNLRPSPVVTTGNDISWPQCSNLRALPTNQSFGIVGVNGGLANDGNPCFSSELAWAQKSTGNTAQSKVSVYVNTGNPGDVKPAVADWPTTNTDLVDPLFNDTDPYGSCTGANDAACSWQYGYNMAHSDVSYRGPANPANYSWYLDVETGNSWSTNLADNAADLEGMVAYLQYVSANVGLYSTGQQWHAIVGNSYGATPDAGGNNLNGLPNWLPGASSQTSAKTLCSQAPFTTNSKVTLTQYISGKYDYDVSCQ